MPVPVWCSRHRARMPIKWGVGRVLPSFSLWRCDRLKYHRIACSSQGVFFVIVGFVFRCETYIFYFLAGEGRGERGEGKGKEGSTIVSCLAVVRRTIRPSRLPSGFNRPGRHRVHHKREGRERAGEGKGRERERGACRNMRSPHFRVVLCRA